MTIDTEAEYLVHFSEAGRSFPGKPVCVATLHRWRLHGVRGAKLESVIIGGLRYTSREAIQRFIRAQNAGSTPAPTVTPKQRQRQSEAARQQLAQAGVL